MQRCPATIFRRRRCIPISGVPAFWNPRVLRLCIETADADGHFAQGLQRATRQAAFAAFQDDERHRLDLVRQDDGQAATIVANQFEPGFIRTTLPHVKASQKWRHTAGFKSCVVEATSICHPQRALAARETLALSDRKPVRTLR
jgi:hypothetical protein